MEEKLDACIIDEKMNEEIITRLLILTDTNVIQIKSEICKSFFLAALTDYNVGDKILLKEIITKIKSSTKCEIDPGDAMVVIEKLTDEKILSHINGLEYKLEKKIPIQNFSTQVSPIWDEFNTFLKENMYDYDIYLDREARPTFENILLQLLIHVASTSENLEIQEESLQEIDMEKIVENIVSKSKLLPDSAKRFPRFIIQYLRSNSPQLQELVYNSYHSTVCMSIMFQAKSLPHINIIENIRYLVLDTSFLVPLFCQTDSRHPLVLAIVEDCKKRNIPLYYLPKTKEEMWRLIDGSNHEMSGLSSSKKAGPVMKNQFVEDFIYQNGINEFSNWDEYYEFLTEWESLLKKMTVQELPNKIKCEINETTKSYISDTISIFGGERSDSQIAHDAYCIGFVDRARENLYGENSRETFGPWFITFDNLLAKADASYQKHYRKNGLVLQPRSLLNYFIVYTGVQFDTKDKQMVSEAILKYSMTATQKTLTIDEYSKLVVNKIGLSRRDISTVKKIILNHPLKEQIKEALKSNRGDLADGSFMDIISNEHYIERVLKFNDQKERIKELAKASAEKDAKIQELTIKNETLREIMLPLDHKTQQKLNALLTILQSEDIFEKGIISRPPKSSNLQKIKEWLRESKEAIETTKTVSEVVTATLPIIKSILECLS